DRHLISAPSQSPKRARICAPAPVRPIGARRGEREAFSFHDRRPPEMGDQEEELAGFARVRPAAFLEVMSSELPDGYATQEVNHLTLAYFAVAGLSLLRELDRVS
uniref:Uncharacterized protein n=1 Tax=Triticum urartu TaxID=4572 RepID=A0A8R7NZR3_TRIUA